MSVHGIPICFACRHRAEGAQTCEAFPDGIPDEIAIDGFDHRKPFNSDGGVRFELKSGKEQTLKLYETARQGK